MQNRAVAVRGIENFLATRLGRDQGFTPIHFNFLPRIGTDAWNLDPDGGTHCCVPLLDLIGKRKATCRGETNVTAIALRFSEVEITAGEAHQHREINFWGTRRDVCAVRSR